MRDHRFITTGCLLISPLIWELAVLLLTLSIEGALSQLSLLRTPTCCDPMVQAPLPKLRFHTSGLVLIGCQNNLHILGDKTPIFRTLLMMQCSFTVAAFISG
jgi:hypothetical protein